MDSSRHPFRKFVFSAIAKSGDGLYYTLTGARYGRSIRLEPSELELARLFDGSRDGATIRKAAAEVLGIEISVAELEGFANELAINDLLVPGTEDPLPVPSQTDGESANLGWSKVGKAAGGGPETIVPSTHPNSLTGAGFPGSLTGLVGAFRGVVAAPSLTINPSLLFPIGMLLNLPLMLGALSMLVLLAAVFGTVAVMYSHRVDMGIDFLRLMAPWKLVLSFLGCIYLGNFLSEIARASAISTLTRSKPLFGLVFGALMIPRFYTHTGGASEAAPRAARLRIVGAAIVAHLMLFVISVGVWLVFRHSHGLLSSLAVMMAMVSSLLFYVQANPLMKRDGYFWLVQWFNAADIREQSFYSLFGYSRPWYEGKKLPTSVLMTYGVLSLIYVAWVMTWILIFPGAWLKASYGPVGVIIVLLLIANSIWRSTTRASSGRSTIGPGKVKLDMPGRGDWIIVGLLAGVALFPYPYEPSGVFTVLPNARAEIRALTQGAVKEVLVKEGELVKAGQVIARISDQEQRAAVASSEATIARLQANLKFSKLGGKTEEVEQVKQQIATLQKKLDFSRAEANRLGAAYKKKAISDQENQRALAVAEVDQQNLLEARKRLALVLSPARNEQLQAIEAEIARAKAELELYQQNLANTEIRAPIAGSIVSGTLRYAVGDYLERGQKLATVEDSSQLMVQIRMSETDIGEIAVGNKGYARPWSLPSGGYPGVIREIAPAADASEYGKVVRVLMSIDQTDGKLLPEMTGYAKVSASTYPLIVSFTRPLTRFVLVEVWSWLP